MREKQWKKGDLTEGPIGKQLLLFALPLLGASFIQQLYNTVDLFFVGNLLGTDATAAVGASSLLTSCIVGFFTGLSVGTGVLVSLAEGEKNGEKIRKIIHTAAGISLLGGVLLTVLGLLLSRQLLVWMNTPAELLEQGLLYIRIYLLSMLPLFVYNMNAGIIRAGGDARTPMLFQLLGAAVNILLDWLSMAHWGMAWTERPGHGIFSDGGSPGICNLPDVEDGCLPSELAERPHFRGNPAARPAHRRARRVPESGHHHIQYFRTDCRQRPGRDCDCGVYGILQGGADPVSAHYVLRAGGHHLRRAESGRRKAGTPAEGNPDLPPSGKRIHCRNGRADASAWPACVRPVYTGDGGDRGRLRIIWVTFPCYWLYVFLEVHADALRGCGRSVLPMAVIMTCLCALRTGLLAVFTNVWGTPEAVAAVYPCAWLAAAACLTVCWRRYAVKPIKK